MATRDARATHGRIDRHRRLTFVDARPLRQIKLGELHVLLDARAQVPDLFGVCDRWRCRLARVRAGFVVMSSSRTASSRTLVRAAIVFFSVADEQVLSHASIVRSIVPVVMLRIGRCPRAGSTRSLIAPR